MAAEPGPAATLTRRPRRIAVVGAGWAGLAAAVRAVGLGHRVTLYDMARQAGGRARGVATPHGLLDNGQHILIGAYGQTLALMRTVGADLDTLLLRQPLRLAYPDGSGLTLPPGAPLWSFTRGVLGHDGWSWRDRLGLLRTAGGWLLQRFRCPADWTVARLCAGLPAAVRRDLVEPLCVAALNTPAEEASAEVFLRVLQDALFGGRGSADLLLPRASLSALLPGPALAWLHQQGTAIRLGRRVHALQGDDHGWQVDGERFDAVVLACSAAEAARLTEPIDPAWSAAAAQLPYEPIVTVYLAARHLRLPAPMTALHADALAPAQFVFDLGVLGTAPGMAAFVVSGARDWVARGLPATGRAVLAQAREAFPGAFDGDPALVICHVAAERRATFACRPGLQRPPTVIAAGLAAAGDYVEGPYPATLEGAVRAGVRAAERALQVDELD